MSLPVLVEVTRGPQVESRHRGSLAIAHADKGMLLELGASQQAVYPRSSIKLIQALQLVESGAADRFGFSDYELAMACASHSSEPRHVEAAEGVLKRINLTEDALSCGAHWPRREIDIAALGAAGQSPRKAHNNCSGKHAGMLAFAIHEGLDPAGYERVEHPVQQRVAAAMADVFRIDISTAPCGVDGCSLPTWAVPVSALAQGFARFFAEDELSAERRAAAARLMAACAAAPHAISGTDRLDSDVMAHFGSSVFLKVGAEGVYVVAFPELKIAAALKIEDGTERAAQVVACALISRFAIRGPQDDAFMEDRLTPPVKNAAGVVAGRLQPARDFTQTLNMLA